MYLEKRKVKSGKKINIKYYLVHSYRVDNRVEKIRKYLGLNLSDKELNEKRKKAEEIILELLKEINTNVFSFSLTKKQIESLNKYDKKIKIHHLNKEELRNFTQDFVYNTNAIEGSTIQLSEVKDILQGKEKPKDHEEIETKNVAKAVEYILENKDKEDLSLDLILKLHKICFQGTKEFAGEFRKVNVGITNFKQEVIHSGVPKQELNEYLNDFIKWYKENKNKFKPLVLAAIIHNQFEHIHPFQDGNGRVGRLLLNFILLKNNYPPINISLEDRQEYYNTLQEYSKKDKLRPTMEFLIKQYKKTLKNTKIKKH